LFCSVEAVSIVEKSADAVVSSNVSGSNYHVVFLLRLVSLCWFVGLAQAFQKALFPSLIQNVALIPYVTISTALCQIILGVTVVFVWDKVVDCSDVCFVWR
jgi:hypothetical protein